MMITPGRAITELRSLIWVPSVRAVVSKCFTGEVSLENFDQALDARELFIVINSLTLDFDQEQQGVLNVNMYAPDKSGVTNWGALDSMHAVVKPLIEDAYTNLLSTQLGNLNVVKEESKKYTFYNQRVQVFADNLNINQNIKL